MPSNMLDKKVNHKKLRGDSSKVKKPSTGKKDSRNRKGSKEKYITDSRLAPKAKKIPAYIDWFHNVHQPPCFVCVTMMGVQFHHIKEHSADERNDEFGLPLCEKHHMGNKLSPHGTPKKFRETYSMEEQYSFAKDMFELYTESL